MSVEQAKAFFDEKVHKENINVEFFSKNNQYTSFIYTKDGAIYEGLSDSDIYQAFMKAYKEAFG